MTFLKFIAKEPCIGVIGCSLPIEDVVEIRSTGYGLRIYTVTGKTYEVHKDFVKIETESNLCQIPN